MNPNSQLLQLLIHFFAPVYNMKREVYWSKKRAGTGVAEEAKVFSTVRKPPET